jgi:O-antigen ligase
MREEMKATPKMVIAVNLMWIASAIVSLDVFYQLLMGHDLLLHRPAILIKHTFPGLPEHVFSGLTGPFKHYNALGAYLATLLSFTVAFILQSSKASKKTMGLCLLLGASLLFSLSRGSWLACTSSLLFFAAVSRYKKIFWVILMILGLVMLLPIIRDRILFTFTSPYGSSERGDIWKLAMQMISENPFLGKGIGTFMDYASAYSAGKYIRYAHNSYLQIWAETGLFALMSFLIFVFSLFREAIRISHKVPDPILTALLVGLFGYLVHAFLDSHFYSLQLAVLFWTIAAMLLARIQQPKVGSGSAA